MAELLTAADTKEGRLGTWEEASSLGGLYPTRLKPSRQRVMLPTTPTRFSTPTMLPKSGDTISPLESNHSTVWKARGSVSDQRLGLAWMWG